METATVSSRRGRRRRQPAGESKVSRLHRPEGMSLEEWQTELRRQFGREQNFSWRTSEPRASSPSSTSPIRRASSAYRVPIRGARAGRQFLLLPRFRHQHAGHLQAHRVHAGHAGAQARRARPLAARLSAALQRGRICTTARAARCASGPAATAPPELAGWPARYFDPDGALLPEAFATFDTFLAEAARLEHELRCYDDALAFIAEVRDAEQRRALHRRGVSARHPQRGLQGPAQRAALRLSARRRAVRGAAPAAACIGDEMGLGKTIQAIAAAEIMARHLRRRARAHRLPDLAQASVGARDRALQPAAASRSIGGLRARREQLFAADELLQDHQLRHRPSRSRPDRGVVAGPRHPRRGAAHQELEHPHRPQRQEDRRRPTPSC